MTKTLEKLYLILYWRLKAYGYPPALCDLAEACNIDQTQVINWLKKLARTGYIKLFLYENGDYNVKFLIEPKREWVVNIDMNANGAIRSIKSEIPIKVFVWDGHVEPLVYFSQKPLDKSELRKQGILV